MFTEFLLLFASVIREWPPNWVLTVLFRLFCLVFAEFFHRVVNVFLNTFFKKHEANRFLGFFVLFLLLRSIGSATSNGRDVRVSFEYLSSDFHATVEWRARVLFRSASRLLIFILFSSFHESVSSISLESDQFK